MQIVKGEPALRRRFLDMEIAQTDPLYYDLLVQYNRSLKQRNRLLKDIREEKASRAQLDPWDEALAGTAAKLLENVWPTWRASSPLRTQSSGPCRRIRKPCVLFMT